MRPPELSLWLNVVHQAVADALNPRSRLRRDGDLAARAAAWIFWPEHAVDFAAVCEMAGLDADHVRARLRAALSNRSPGPDPGDAGRHTGVRSLPGAAPGVGTRPGPVTGRQAPARLRVVATGRRTLNER